MIQAFFRRLSYEFRVPWTSNRQKLPWRMTYKPRARSTGRNHVREREADRHRDSNRTRDGNYHPHRSAPPPSPAPTRTTAPTPSTHTHRSVANALFSHCSVPPPSSSRTYRHFCSPAARMTQSSCRCWISFLYRYIGCTFKIVLFSHSHPPEPSSWRFPHRADPTRR